MAYNAIGVAKYAVSYTNRMGYHINLVRLQNVLYYLQAKSLVNTGLSCFVDTMYAQDIGPVIPAIGEYYHRYGIRHIPIEGKAEEDYGITRGAEEQLTV